MAREFLGGEPIPLPNHRQLDTSTFDQSACQDPLHRRKRGMGLRWDSQFQSERMASPPSETYSRRGLWRCLESFKVTLQAVS
jgi:hypothetical protein